MVFNDFNKTFDQQTNGRCWKKIDRQKQIDRQKSKHTLPKNSLIH